MTRDVLRDGIQRIAYVCGADLRGPSEKQALGWSVELCRRGARVVLLLGSGADRGDTDEISDVPGLDIRAWATPLGRVRPRALQVIENFHPDVVHAFNPRHPVITATRRIVRGRRCRVAVHFEDDEWNLASVGRDRVISRGLAHVRRAVRVAAPTAWPYMTGQSLTWAVSSSHGLDAVAPALAQHVTLRTGRPCRTILPTLAWTNEVLNTDRSTAEERPVVVFTGSVFKQHREDFALAMRAVALVAGKHPTVRFVHTGSIARDVDPHALASDCGLDPRNFESLGQIPHSSLRQLLASATVALQPGRDTSFNRLRLPSKLQTYLGCGVPTIMFAAGFGEELADRDEVLKTYTDDPSELASRIDEIITHRELAERLSVGGRDAARRLFDPARNVDELVDFYSQIPVVDH